MKRILFILLVVTASTTVMAGMSTSKVRKETRFLTDKMAYELDLSNPQYNMCMRLIMISSSLFVILWIM